MKSSLHSLIHFLPFILNQLQLPSPELDAILDNSLKRQSQSYVTTDGQSAILSWYKAPICGLTLDFYYCQTVAGFLTWGVLSDERTCQSFARLSQQ
jgi:hypothetical protein